MPGHAGRGAHSAAGRTPWPTWRASSACTRARSSGWVTPMQRPVAGSTVNGYGRASRPPLRAAAPRPPRRLPSRPPWPPAARWWKAGVNPHRFIDTRASGDSVEGSRPSRTAKPPSGSAVTWRRSSTSSSWPSGPTWQMPRVTGAWPTTASARRNPTRALVGSGPSRWAARSGEAAPPVDVVGVPHAVGRVAHVVRRAAARRGRCRAAPLAGRSGRRRGRARCVSRGSGWPGPVAGPSTRTMEPKPAARASLATRSMTASPRGPTGARGLQPP